RSGAARGPLHGLPIAIKDLVHIRGKTTSAGSKARPHGVAGETATSAEHLLAAGMIPLGKTHLVEFAYGTWGRNAPMGAPWNPWDTKIQRVAGGSSSGSAVAVAAGLAPAALGSDTGGSIRIPAALCGVTGLKPTYVLAARGATLGTRRSLGASVEETRVACDLENLVVRNGRIIAAEAWAVHRSYIEDEALPFDPPMRARLLAAKAISAADYIEE